MDEMQKLISHARKEGVRSLRLSGGDLKVEFFQREGDLIPPEDPGEPQAEKLERQGKREDNPTGGLLSPEDVRLLMDPYHGVKE
jgi:hypothetical protein